MANIKSYIQQDDGTITAVIEGVTLENKDFLLLDNGLEVECDVIISDPYKITDKQRRKIFVMVRDIFNHYGNKVLALCRKHHNQQHDMGMSSFNKLHHLENAWVDVDDKLNSMLRGEKQ